MLRSHISALVVFALALIGVSTAARADVPYPDQIAPGQLRGIALHDTDPWPMGYWEYLPANYAGAPETQRWPLLVFIGGIGQSDEFSQCPGGTDTCLEADCPFEGLCRATRRGPMRLMREGNWDDTQRNYIFISPQHNIPALSTAPWNPDELDAFFQYVIDNYPIDTRRMYLVGMSQGGRGVLQYAEAYPRRMTAIGPTPGGAVAQDVTCRIQDTAVWAFHGEDDTDANLGTGVFDPCWMARRIHMANNPGSYPGFPACVQRATEDFPTSRITMFYDEGHEVWVPANDPVNVGFDTDSWATAQDCLGVPVAYTQYLPQIDADGIYTWFNSLDRPDVQAPDDFTVQATSAMVTATVIDDDAITWSWTQTSGPPATLSQTDQATLMAADLQPDETYDFEVRVVDSDGQWDIDTVELSTGMELAGTTGGDPSSTGGDASSTGSDAGSTSDAVDPSTTADSTTTDDDSTTGQATTDDASTTAQSSTGEATTGTGATTAPSHESAASWTAGSDNEPAPDADGDGGCTCTSNGNDRPALLPLWALGLLGLRRGKFRR